MAKAKAKKEEKLTLEQVLYNCRTALRGVGATDDNRNAVIGLVFLKFAYDKYLKCRETIIHRSGQPFADKDAFYRREGVFPIPEEARWDYLVQNASSANIATLIDVAMAKMEEKNPTLAGALPSNLYSSLGANQSSIKRLIDEVNKINENLLVGEEDIIGRVYEYFLQSYAAGGAKEDGEFYTPACVVQLIAELIEPYEGTVYDPCCGSGGMFIQSLKFVENHSGDKMKISVVGQESKLATWKLAKMNLAIRGISHDLGTKNDSTFTNDLHKDRDGNIDYIMANPPFNLKDWRGADQLLTDSRWRGYAVPRASNANYAWILHILSKLKPNKGIAGFLLANGALNEEDEFENRKRLLGNDKVEAIIVLPRDMFYTTDISVTLWILNNNKNAQTLNGRKLRKRVGEVLFLDLRRWNQNIGEYVIEKGKSKKKRILVPSQIEEIKQIYHNWQSAEKGKYRDIPELCKSATLLDIEKQNYNLAPSKYIEFIDRDLEIDYEKEMSRIQGEMNQLLAKEKASQKMLEDAFKGIGYDI